ncbi:MAG: nicotinamide mononucleotide transporter [Ruminococcaceae bacterium]|nr:nicotinamide mononucleotide transporter [Oscillospiraceae bacterium]
MLVIIVSFFFSESNVISLVASLMGVTALIFIAKGYVIGQIFVIIFAILYGIISFELTYYGEMITYVGMSAPIALISAITWLKNPYQGSKEVKVAKLTSKKVAILLVLTVAVTTAFYFILGALGNANLIVSTVSVATSFFAASLTVLRSPYYALAYSLNDIVLIALWGIATINDISNLPTLMCFVVFLANDTYGFVNWRRMQKRQDINA